MRIVDSPNYDERPAGRRRSRLVVLHSISLPPGEYGGDAIERLFTNRLDPQAHPYFREIRGLKVSSHFLIRRDGEVVQFVPVERRAWHAGASSWRGREPLQRLLHRHRARRHRGRRLRPMRSTQRLARLLMRLPAAQLPLRDVAAHSDVAPGRKTDPGAHFDWARLLAGLAQRSAPLRVSHTRSSALRCVAMAA